MNMKKQKSEKKIKLWGSSGYKVTLCPLFLICKPSLSSKVKWSRSVMSFDPMDCSLPGSSAHGILQARILEWVTIPFFRGSSRASNWTQVSSTAGRFSTVWAAREAQFPITFLTQSTTLPLIHCIPSRLASWLSLSMLVTLSSQGICLCHSLICQLSPSRFFFMPWSFTSFIVLLECHLLWGLP